jgi:hypothetical protein
VTLGVAARSIKDPLSKRILSHWFAAALLLLGCGDSHAPSPVGDNPVNPTVKPADSCRTPNAGCDCEDEGEVVACAVTQEKTNDYAICQHGSRACVDGTWGACELDGTTDTMSLPKGPGQRPLGLGTTASCAAENVCDPFCRAIVDDSVGLVLDPANGTEVTPTGLQLIPHEIAPSLACTALVVTPNPGALTVTQLSPLSPSALQLTAVLTPLGCYPGVPPVLWAIDRFDIATIDDGLLTLVSPIAAPITVTAYAGSLSTSVTVNVKVNITDVSAAPVGTPLLFPLTTGTADTATILYPYAETVLPLGLLPPLLQWSYGSAGAATAVKVTLRYPATGTSSFSWSTIVAENQSIKLNPPTNTITLPAGPRAEIPTAVWKAFEQTAKGQNAAIVLQRLTSLATRRAEIVTPIKFATNQLKGTVYYQSYGTNVVQNYGTTLGAQSIGGGIRFGAATLAIRPGDTYPTAAAGYATASDGPGCRVCHSASANGNALVTNASGSVSYFFKLGIDAANGGTAFSGTDGRYAWPALYPDGTFLFSGSGPPSNYSSTAPPGGLDGSDSGSLGNKLYSTVAGSFGATVASTGIPSALRATLPVFSPDGTKLAFNHYGGTVSGIAGDKRSLGMMDFNNATKTFSNFRRLVTEPTTACSTDFGTTDPCTNVWPSILPSNAGVVYQREIFNNGRVPGSNHSDFGGTRSGCDGTGVCADNGMRGELWWVTTASTPVATRLNLANGRNAAGTVTLPTTTHLGDLDGQCETGENCAEYNPAAGGNDDWKCDAGETCMEDPTGSGNKNYICETGERCAEDQSSHTALNEPVLNYEPNVNPQSVGGYNWVVFTSRRRFGNVATMNPWWSDPRYKPIGGQFGATPKKIWVSALDENATSGTDPSHPAFYLPGQEWLAGNSKAYWVLDACKAASNTRSTATECESDLDCCGAPSTSSCSLQKPIANPPKRHCIPKATSGCIADNAATTCSSDAQCCGFSSGSRCASGVCRTPDPLVVFSPGTFTRDFVAECSKGQKPVWQMLQWKASLPLGTSIAFTAASAATSAALATAVTVVAGQASTSTSGTAWSTNPVNLDTNLRAAKVGSLKYLRIVSTLNPSLDTLRTPTLSNWRVVYDCFDAE